jgi:hypothetical protein
MLVPSSEGRKYPPTFRKGFDEEPYLLLPLQLAAAVGRNPIAVVDVMTNSIVGKDKIEDDHRLW